MEASIELHDATEEMRKASASVIKLPENHKKQPDLQYFSAIFVSSGTNLNMAHFLPSELVLAAETVPSKAVDIEHDEVEIIGHIYDYAFIDQEGNKLNVLELANMEKASLDTKDMHIVIAGIIYKSRFPNIAAEVAAGKWKVSMEAYYQDYDIKVGNMILDKKEADMLGFSPEKAGAFGSLVKIIKKGVEIASGKAARVLRGICFSGVGIVKNPANPPSVILETANEKTDMKDEKDTIILNYDKVLETSNNVTSPNIETDDSELAELTYNDTVGICVNYKKRLVNEGIPDQDTVVARENWCTAYDKGCTSFSRDTTDPDCLRNSIPAIATACLEALIAEKEQNDRRAQLVDNLLTKVSKAKKK